MPTPNKPSEKRRHNRHKTNVAAVLTIGEATTTECAILDFSEQGLFLQLQPSSIVALQKDNGTKIYFSAITDAGKEYFQIDAQIARIAEQGIGVAFENIAEPMYNALMETAGSGTIAAYSKNPGVFLTSSSQVRFKEAFKEMLNKNLPMLLGKFFDYAFDELEKAPEFAENFKDVAAQTNLISILRLNKDSLIKNYCEAITREVDFTSEPDDKTEKNSIEAGLSLVEKNAFEDWLSLSAIIKKITSQYKSQLTQLEIKLSYVTCFPRYLIKNPINPKQLCDTFHDHVASIEDSVAAKKMLYKAFKATLDDHLPPLYKAFDALLIEYGAPNDVAYDIVWKKNYPTNSKKNTFSDTSKSADHLPSFDNDAYFYPESYNPAAPALSPIRPSYQQPITQTASKLFNLISQGLPSAQATIANHAQPDKVATNQTQGSVYTPEELLAALTQLQAAKTMQNLPQNASTLLQEQLDESLSTSAYLGSKSFSLEDKTKLNVYDQLFQALLSEVVLTPNIKSYLESIKLPLMSLTLQDPNFLDSETHPARNLLNQLFSLDSAVNENRIVKNTKIKQLLDQLMAKIAQGAVTDPNIFAKANEELKDISVPIAKTKELNIRRVIEVYEGKQKLERARQKIQSEIDTRLADKTIPVIIQLLLDSGWQHLLVITELNEEQNNTTNHLRYFKVIDELLRWYDNLERLTDEQFSAIEMEIEFISVTLEPVCSNAFLHNKVIEELKATLLGTGKPRVRKPVDRVVIERKAVEIIEVDNEFITDSSLLQVDQFEIGDWFTFSLEKEAFEPLKLVWIGDFPSIYVFVNRDGYKKQEFTRNQLAELLESGIVSKIENLDEPLMDRATTTMLQQMQEKLVHSISHDPVTNLPNRKRFINLVKEHIANFNNSAHVLCHLEIEDFRIITNVCGLVGGDQLLLQIAQLISNNVGENGIYSRLGDKTFGILLKNCSADEGYETVKNLRNLINKTNFTWDDKSFTIGASIGLVPVIEGAFNMEELLQKADTVNISAKRSGHNRIRVYKENDESLKTQTDIHEWAGRIDRIFSENRLFARCQMIAPVNPEKNNHSHYEILLGVRDEVGNIIAPDKFIPAVERCQRMPEIDRWIVENVFEWIIQNKRSFDKIGGFAINLSGQSLNSEEFLIYLKDRLSVQDIPAEKITFEVTETVAAGSLVFTKRFIKEIKQFGCKFSLDDFGTGYSSYSYLKSLDVDYLKIDGSFIKDIADSPTDVVMVNSMNEIAHSLELETIAEYVENLKILAILKELGVDYAQGWGIHKPSVLSELAALLESQETNAIEL